MKNLFSPVFFRPFFISSKKWIVPFVLLLAMSCGTPNNQFIGEVKKLEDIISKSIDSLQKVDTSKIGNYLRISNENLKFIQENFKDTISKETAILLSDYSASRKSLRMFLESYTDAVKELNYSRNQLFALKTDLENSLMEENKFSDFYSSESKSVEKLEELIRNILQWYDSALKMYETKSPPVEKIILQAKEKLAISQ